MNSKSNRYYKIIIPILVVIVLIWLVLGIGRSKQISMIDRFNPFLQTETGYAVLPSESKVDQPHDVYTVDNALKSGDWLKVITGESKGTQYIAVRHKGSYVSSALTVQDKEAVPSLVRQQLGNEYHQYNRSIEGPRSSNRNILWPFD